jgi:hypothetical protein
MAAIDEQKKPYRDPALAILANQPQDATHDWQWRDWLHCEILCREAAELLAIHEPQSPPDPQLQEN